MNDENETNKKPLDTGGEAEVQNTPADKNTSGIDDSLYNPYEELSDSFDEMKEEAGVEEFSPDASIVPPPDEDEPNTAMEADEPNTDNSNADKTVDVENSLDDDRVVEAPDYLSALTDEEASEIEEEEKSKSGEDAIQSDDTGGGFGTTKEAAKDMSFDSQKVSVLEASRKPTNKSGPKTLNKKFLLSAVTITLGGIFLAAILLPSGRHKKKDEEEKPVGGISLGNIEAYAKRSERPKTPVYYKEQEGDRNMKDVKSSADEKPQRETKYDENGEVILPPVEIIDTNPKPYYAATPASTTGTGGSGGGSSQIPDTRNDRLQGKSISGIKGLTSSQSSYSTDYEATIAENTSAPAQMPGALTLPSREEFIKSSLNAYKGLYGGQGDDYAQQNNQSGKLDFYNGANNDRKLDPVTGVWLGLNTVWQGSIFEAVLTSEINTDLPGEVTARVAKDIYSSQDGRFLLIPQNSTLYGTYNSSISYAQSRVQVVWNTLIRPDGYQIDLGGMNGTDAKGAAGLKGFVNDHPLAYVKAILLMSVFSAINTEFADDIDTTDNKYAQNAMANAQQVTDEMGQKLIDRAMNVQPTIKIKAGTKINIVANQTVSLPPVQITPVTQQYRRQ